MKKISLLLIPALFALCLLTACKSRAAETQQTGASSQHADNSILFHRMEALLRSTACNTTAARDDSGIAFCEITDINGDIIKVEAIEGSSATDYYTEYIIYQNDTELERFFVLADYWSTYHVQYADITQDGQKDVAVIGARPKGPYAGTEWIHVYDAANKTVVNLFDGPANESYLTTQQKSELTGLLGDEFYETFPAFEEIYSVVGELYVDTEGNVYYELPILIPEYYSAEHALDGHLGEIILLFSYDHDLGTLHVADCIYLPK